jgi:DNA-binding transcriptional regulator YbjK
VATSTIPGAPGTDDQTAAAIDRRRAPATREAILRATLVLVANEGVGAVSNRRVAAEAGVSLGSLTYHFPSQAELLRESLFLYVGEEVERLEQLAAALRAREPDAEEVVGEVEMLIARPTGGPGPLAELELHLQAARDPALQEASQRCFAAYEALAVDALAALGVPDPTRHAGAVVALITGLGLRRLGTGAADSEAVTDSLLTFLRGALADPAA